MTITITTTAGQDTVLQRLLTKTNANRAAAGQPALADVPALVVLLLTNNVQAFRDQQISEDASAVADAYVTGDATKRQAIKAAAGV
jgi:hypothetical protein